jgi:hypothetical protein
VGSGQDTGAVGHASEREKTGIGYCSPLGRHARYARMTGWLAALASRGPSDCSLLAGISDSLARGRESYLSMDKGLSKEHKPGPLIAS